MSTGSMLDLPGSPAELAQPMLPEVWRIGSTRRETYDTFTVELQHSGNGRALTFAPGQFNMLYMFGVGEVPISISGDPTRPETLVHTIRAVGPVTAAMSRQKRGQAFGVRGPYGTAWPVQAARGKDVVIAAGGIGLAPLRPALYHLLAHRDDYGRVILLYGARTPRDLLFRNDLEQWRGRLDVEVEVTVDTAQEDWRGDVGLVTSLLPRARFDPTHAVAMICGPEIMMRFTVLGLAGMGLPQANIYVSMERNMKCALGYCGHCQFGPTFICKDGPVFPFDRIERLLAIREV
jgi:NAD(P)H-flavin reductase